MLDPKEYDDSQWLTPETIIAGDFHPALKFAVHAHPTLAEVVDEVFKQVGSHAAH